ncbi:hypothetical protein Aduo_001478 [Ancylostoma duodenale]
MGSQPTSQRSHAIRNGGKFKKIFYKGKTASDRLDLLARVFNGKLKELHDDLFKKGVFGEVDAYVYVIEFQKRGLPHCHMLDHEEWMESGWKAQTVNDVDNANRAEIPKREQELQAFATVISFMIHRKCGAEDVPSPCMRDGKCSKRFPKQLGDRTSMDVDGYPKYRKRNNTTVEINGSVYGDEWVVPTNLYLLTKFSCHLLSNTNTTKVREYVCTEHWTRTKKKKNAADDILAALDREEQRCFFIGGPGGTGKTYLYSTTYDLAIGQRRQVLCVAPTGVAANLLPGGRTVNSAFKLNMADGNRSKSEVLRMQIPANLVKNLVYEEVLL